MTGRLGPRFGLEAAFLIAVAVVLGLLEIAWPAIIAGMAIAWLVVAGVEVALSRRPEPEPLVEPEAEPEVVAAPEPPAAEEPAPLPQPEAAPEPEPEPEPALPPPPPPPVLTPVPPEADPEPEPQVVELRPAAPREWNVWELERIARLHAGADPGLDEERSFVLMSLREFASPDGVLPADFDGVVRESFGDLLFAAR